MTSPSTRESTGDAHACSEPTDDVLTVTQQPRDAFLSSARRIPCSQDPREPGVFAPARTRDVARTSPSVSPPRATSGLTKYNLYNVRIYTSPFPYISTFASAPIFALLLRLISIPAIAIALVSVVAPSLVLSGYVLVRGAGESASLPVVDVRQ